MFIAAIFTIAKLWKHPRCPTIDEWIKKMWFLYMMEFYSAIKKNEILSFAGKWMELENIILSEVSQAQKTKNPMFSLICRLYFFLIFLFYSYVHTMFGSFLPLSLHPLPYPRPPPLSPQPLTTRQKLFCPYL
jgi:hypothetical protein